MCALLLIINNLVVQNQLKMNKTNLRQSAQEIINCAEVTVSYRNKQKVSERTKIGSSSNAYFYVKPLFGMELELREKFFCILMNQAAHVIAVYKVGEGGITATVADIRLILSVALVTYANQIIVAHNHPSGNLTPSAADKELTHRLKTAAAFHDIKVLDHLIITEESYFSFGDEGLI